MKFDKWKTYAMWIVLSLAVGGLSGLLSRGGLEVYLETAVQPVWSPPPVVFPIVWSILYTLMGVGAARIWLSEDSVMRSRGLNIFIAQLVVNFFWSLIFFNLQAFGFAFIWLLLLWGLVAWMIAVYSKADPLAAWLQVPYLLWITFAAFLNAAVWFLNR